MDRMEIKFWNKNREGYVTNEVLKGMLLINSSGEVVYICIDGEMVYPIHDFEPHFYVDGKRVL